MKLFIYRIIAFLWIFLFNSFAFSSSQFDTARFIEIPSLMGTDISRIQQLYFKKCAQFSRSGTLCTLTEHDIFRNGKSDNILVFRGEPNQFPSPATSSYFRWATSATGYCSLCNKESIVTELLIDLRKLSASFLSTAKFRPQDRSWADVNGKTLEVLSEGNTSPVEIISRIHKQGSGLYFEGTNRLFDPLVSFSASPQIALQFAKTKEQIGVVYLVSIEKKKLKEVKKENCKDLIPEVGRIYDLNACMDDVLNQSEFELNVFMYLPKDYFIGKISGM